MVKPPRRPELHDDAHYLTIVHAFPPHPDMELDKDVRECAFWLATIVGDPSVLRGIYHKPATHSMTVVAIEKDYTDLRRILGAHRWEEFLHNPKAYGSRVTRIYFCQMGTDQDLSKTGWKYKNINLKWFDNWTINNSVVKFPYPLPTYCDLPTDVEDPTNRLLCRQLPVDVYPEAKKNVAGPKNASKPIVGSAEYFQSKSGGQGAASGSGRSGAKKRAPSAASSSSRAPYDNPQNSWDRTEREPPEAWSRPHPSSSVPSGNTASDRFPSDRAQPQFPALGAPPGLSAPRWSDTSYGSGSGHTDPTGDMHEKMESLWDDGYDSEGEATNAPSAMYNHSATGSSSVTGEWPTAHKDDYVLFSGTGEDEDDGWSGAPVLETVEEEEPTKYYWQPDCPVHGKKCKPGICIHLSKKKARERRDKEFEERMAERKEKKEKKQKQKERKEKTKEGAGQGSHERWTRDEPSGGTFESSSRNTGGYSSSSSWGNRGADTGGGIPSHFRVYDEDAGLDEEDWGGPSTAKREPERDWGKESASGRSATGDEDEDDDGWRAAPASHDTRGWNDEKDDDGWGAAPAAHSGRGWNGSVASGSVSGHSVAGESVSESEWGAYEPTGAVSMRPPDAGRYDEDEDVGWGSASDAGTERGDIPSSAVSLRDNSRAVVLSSKSANARGRGGSQAGSTRPSGRQGGAKGKNAKSSSSEAGTDRGTYSNVGGSVRSAAQSASSGKRNAWDGSDAGSDWGVQSNAGSSVRSAAHSASTGKKNAWGGSEAGTDWGAYSDAGGSVRSASRGRPSQPPPPVAGNGRNAWSHVPKKPGPTSLDVPFTGDWADDIPADMPKSRQVDEDDGWGAAPPADDGWGAASPADDNWGASPSSGYGSAGQWQSGGGGGRGGRGGGGNQRGAWGNGGFNRGRGRGGNGGQGSAQAGYAGGKRGRGGRGRGK